MQKHDLNSLNQICEEAKSCDEELFAEMRSNLLLVSGNHYTKKSSRFFSNVRNSQKLNETQKLRITKNHIHKISRHYKNSILAKVPGVVVAPKNELDLQDKKQAELNEAVRRDAVERYGMKQKMREFADSFVDIGEVCAFMYFDPNAGELRGFAQAIDEEGNPVFDEMGQMVQDKEKPIFKGEFVFKNIPGYNLRRSPNAKTMESSPYHIFEEMVPRKELEEAYKDDPAKMKAIGEGDAESFVVFDSNKGQYRTEDRDVAVQYVFFKPCKAYPEGYFYIKTTRGILDEGDIPYGIYPLIWEGFDTFSGHPRGFSIIKVARPFQAEINRASSQAATHQITVGDDKIIYQGGTKLSQGALLPGVRGITYQGQAPQILAGRAGEQFTAYIQSQITEMYDACMIEEINAETSEGQVDPYGLLFKSASQQQKFGQYTAKFENFQKKFWMTYFELAKKYMPDDEVIMAVGKNEAINLQEFKNTTPLAYQIKVEEQTETIDERMGRQLALNHIIQFAGNQLNEKTLGLLLKEMPFLNNNTLIKRMSLDYDNVENDMLQLERGQLPFISPYADNQVYIESVTHRMKQPDFQILPMQVQQLYDQYLSIHEDQVKVKMEAAQAAKDGFIPTGGSLITIQMSVPDPSSQSGSRQVKLPYEAVWWLIQRLEAQGSSLQALESMNQGAIVDIQGRAAPQPQGQMPALPGGQSLPA